MPRARELLGGIAAARVEAEEGGAERQILADHLAEKRHHAGVVHEREHVVLRLEHVEPAPLIVRGEGTALRRVLRLPLLARRGEGAVVGGARLLKLLPHQRVGDHDAAVLAEVPQLAPQPLLLRRRQRAARRESRRALEVRLELPLVGRAPGAGVVGGQVDGGAGAEGGAARVEGGGAGAEGAERGAEAALGGAAHWRERRGELCAAPARAGWGDRRGMHSKRGIYDPDPQSLLVT